ncbi:hypothetical protein [Actinoallomurus liliacearum]|uniref:hypothetical protein n=1 Tax=Actinoallomurus liliacearum TaxID=1080073 RepID=UPI0031E818AE
MPPAWREQLVDDGRLVEPLRMNGPGRWFSFRGRRRRLLVGIGWNSMDRHRSHRRVVSRYW